jgi:hypothetical protein
MGQEPVRPSHRTEKNGELELNGSVLRLERSEILLFSEKFWSKDAGDRDEYSLPQKVKWPRSAKPVVYTIITNAAPPNTTHQTRPELSGISLAIRTY